MITFSTILSLCIIALAAYAVYRFISADENRLHTAFAKWLFVAVFFILLSQISVVTIQGMSIDWHLKLGSLIIVILSIQYIKNRHLKYNQ